MKLNQIQFTALLLGLSLTSVVAQTNSSESAADCQRTVQAGLEFADELPDARLVPRREVRHLGALGTAVRAGARRLVCAQHV